MYFNSLRPFMSWKYSIRLIILICGLFIVATGTICIYRSDLGLDPWDVLHQGINLHTPLSFGTASIVVGALVLLAGLLLKVYPGVGTLLNMVLIGLLIDWQLRLNWLPDLGGWSLASRCVVDIIGIILIGIGIALYIAPHMGAGPRDGLMLRLHALLKLRIAIVRTALESSALLIGFLLGGSVGIGTIFFVLGIGPAIEISLSLIKKLRFIESLQPIAADLPSKPASEPSIPTFSKINHENERALSTRSGNAHPGSHRKSKAARVSISTPIGKASSSILKRG